MTAMVNSKLTDVRRKCVLFRSCDSLSPCASCFTGPSVPDLAGCMMEADGGEQEAGEDYEDFGEGVGKTSFII